MIDRKRGLYLIWATVLLGILLSLAFGINEYALSATGASISVEGYGISDELRSLDSGKMQTLIEVDKLGVKELLTIAGRVELAEEILAEVDFPAGIVELYQNNPPAPLPAGTLGKVREAAAREIEYFRNNLPCLYEIAVNHQYQMSNLQLALISELKIQKCSKNNYLLFANMKHTFFDYGEGGYICDEENGKLFLIDKNSGEVSTDLSAC